ncbi:Amidohydrolase [Thalassoglobus neptunius]|uniref:Amidohydrolase n=1 Tax=Thalassoglobus neptunius TaxID=1938619 RepID=A0A5C5WJE2_9PLAN|nr:amidohydrolase family protein [Thalassoglobus neptunius]TWT49962.1 Amidohydrolase [Thalassoglobus neptunius]
MAYRSLLFLCVACLGIGSSLPAQDVSGDSPRRIYLDEFRPTPVLKVDENILRSAKFPCVNVHSHPGKLSVEELNAMVETMDEANIAVSVSLDGPAGPKFADHIHFLKQTHPNRFVVFVRIDYIGDGDEDDPATWDVHQKGYGVRMADQLTEAVRQGASGLKVWKNLGLYLKDLDGNLIPPDDRRLDPIWTRAGELGVPVLWHCADPVAFFSPTNEYNERWEELYRHPEWSFYGEEFPTHQELMEARNRVIARHPETTFICAHMGDIPEDLKTLGSYLDALPNMQVEIAARVAELGRQPYSARKFFLKYSDRIMFGTDGVPPMSELIPHFRFLETWDENFPYEDNPFPPQGLWNIYGIGLPDSVLEKVYYKNAARVIPGVSEALSKWPDRASANGPAQR